MIEPALPHGHRDRSAQFRREKSSFIAAFTFLTREAGKAGVAACLICE
jgi:hypothetical protein